MKLTKYRTPTHIVKIVIDSIGKKWIAATNDFEFHDNHLDDLDWKSKEEAQADLDKIANDLGLEID
ncbi:hypothetical protein LCGC14_2502130 [marine sediment metagenome]|uniref:Uncharacterized protein n=1 Tax=marine sediment metagenome TaxID=412755 RepID=A0A0F9B2C9_9ZZZZ